MAKKVEPAADEAATEQGVTAEQAQSAVELVAMHRDAPLHENGPTTADVHPAEVDNYRSGGWELSGDA